MKLTELILIIMSFCLLGGCEMNVFFDDAMPPGVAVLNYIPEEYQGIYLCQSDSNQIYVEDRIIFEQSNYQFIADINRVKETENCSIVDGGLYIPGKKQCFPFVMINEDSLMAIITYRDTLFSIGERQIVKQHKGRLFLNQQTEEQNWITFMITPSGGGELLWELIDVPDKEETISSLTENYEAWADRSNELKYTLRPTLIEFEELIKQETNMMECDVLIPISIEKYF